MKRAIESNIATSRWGLALLYLLILICVSWVSYHSTVTLLERVNLERHTRAEIAGLQEILFEITDAETGRRGYVITGQEQFLRPYNRATSTIEKQLKQLQQRFSNDALNEQRQFNELKSMVIQRLSLLEQSINLKKQHESDDDIQIALNAQGKALQEQIRALITEIQNKKGQELRLKAEQSTVQATRTIAVILAGFCLSLTIFLWVYYLLSRQIIQRQQAEAALAKSEKRLRTIIEAEPECVEVLALDGTIQEMNAAGLAMMEANDLQQVIGQPACSLVTPEHRDSFTALTQQAAVGNPGILQFELVGLRGTRRWLETHAVPLRNEQNEITGVLSITRDITAQKQAEVVLKKAKDELEIRVADRTGELVQANHQLQQIAATLLEAERRWRSLLENVRLVVVGLDRNGKLEYVNPFFLELVGYTKTEVEGQDWFKTFLPPHQRSRLQNSFLELLEQEFYTHEQSIILTKSGSERLIAWNNTLLKNLQGDVIGTLSIGEDITERHAIERMKDEFVSVVSHELRTPLTSIHGALNLLSSGLVEAQSDKGRRVIEIAAENAERLVRLVNDILELERLEAGKISLSKQSCNATELLIKATDLMQVMANHAGITLSVSPQAIQLEADPDRIIQVLTNLLGNAIKFSSRGSTVWLTVERVYTHLSPPYPVSHEQKAKPLLCSVDVACQQDIGFTGTPTENGKALVEPRPRSECLNSFVLFAVKDQGRGIPADKIESIFERFHQVDASDSRKKGGTGLGLAICRSIVQQHGGRIWAESTLGEGSCFYFTLPTELGIGGNP